MFDLLVHADWSSNHQKRWMATAESHGGGWEVDAPRPVPAESELLEDLAASGRRVLAGFDFPIGLPVTFGKQTGFSDFVSALSVFGFGEWHRFFDVADRPEEISLKRPFYPNTCVKGRKQAHLFGPLGVSTIDELLRQCERETGLRPAACSLFWTLGGNQVGKAAISGGSMSCDLLWLATHACGHFMDSYKNYRGCGAASFAKLILGRLTVISA